LQFLQYAFTIVLIGVLTGAVVAFLCMGIAKVRRTRRLAGLAHQRGMRFFPDDPYDVPRRYAGFAVVSGGHSPRANNVIDGRLEGRPVRAFDFRCELGHGTRRTTRHYAVIALEAERASEPLLMWHADNAETPPLATDCADGQVGQWRYRGSRQLAEAMAESCKLLDEAPANIEIRDAVLVVATPAREHARDCAVRFRQVEAAAGAWRGAAVGPHDPGPSG
jgi:hypothetical protein